MKKLKKYKAVGLVLLAKTLQENGDKNPSFRLGILTKALRGNLKKGKL